MKTILVFLIASASYATAYCQTADDYFNRGNSKYDLQDYRGAIADFTKAIELKPNNADIYFNRGNSKQKLQDRRGCIADLTKAIEIDPNYADAYFYRGLAKFTLGQKNSGCLDLSKAGELGHEDAYEAIRKVCN